MGRKFGRLSGIEPGAVFASRAELAAADIHRPRQAGISGSAAEGADSIVVSGGYEDDEDYGDVIIYTGQGGNDPQSKHQIADQSFERGNKALAVSNAKGFPVRVVRGPDPNSEFAPQAGYRYDGLYYVDKYWQERGQSGFLVWRYRLVREERSGEIPIGGDRLVRQPVLRPQCNG